MGLGCSFLSWCSLLFLRVFLVSTSDLRGGWWEAEDWRADSRAPRRPHSVLLYLPTRKGNSSDQSDLSSTLSSSNFFTSGKRRTKSQALWGRNCLEGKCPLKLRQSKSKYTNTHTHSPSHTLVKLSLSIFTPRSSIVCRNRAEAEKVWKEKWEVGAVSVCYMVVRWCLIAITVLWLRF